MLLHFNELIRILLRKQYTSYINYSLWLWSINDIWSCSKLIAFYLFNNLLWANFWNVTLNVRLLWSRILICLTFCQCYLWAFFPHFFCIKFYWRKKEISGKYFLLLKNIFLLNFCHSMRRFYLFFFFLTFLK